MPISCFMLLYLTITCSKPGAAAMSTWFSNQTIGLDPSGYGMLLGEAAFTSARVS